MTQCAISSIVESLPWFPESRSAYSRLTAQRLPGIGAWRPLIAGALAAFEERLDPASFFRASRRHLINLNSIEAAEWGAGGYLTVRMRGGVEIELSRRQSANLKELLSL